MKSKLRKVVLIIICMCLTGWYAIIDKPVSLYNTECDTSAFQSITLEKGKEMLQTFIGVEEYIDGVALKVAADGVKDKSQATILYEIKDSDSGKSIVSGETNLKKLSSGKFFKIKFERIPDTKGKKFVLKIAIKDCPAGNVRVFYAPGTDSNAMLVYDGQNIDGIGVVRTLTHRFDMETYIVTLCFLAYIVLFMRWLYKLFE